MIITVTRTEKLSSPKVAIRLDVPFYSQHYDFTCGPASLMMAMKYSDRSINLSKDLEMDIWREANMVESYGTSRYGLAFSAAQRGFKARVYSNIKGYGFLKKLETPLEGLDYRMLRLFFAERRMRCKKLGVGDRRCEIRPALIRRSLYSESVPLLLTSTKHFSAEEEDLPHWIVITGIDSKSIYLNNPLDRISKAGGRRRKRLSLNLPVFRDICGYKGDQCMIEIRR